MLVYKIWWVYCHKQHWEGEKKSQKEKKNSIGWKYFNYIVWDCRIDSITSKFRRGLLWRHYLIFNLNVLQKIGKLYIILRCLTSTYHDAYHWTKLIFLIQENTFMSSLWDK